MGLGDEIMAAGQARQYRLAHDSGPVGIVDRWDRRRWHPIWQYCPDVARPEEISAPTIINAGKARPYIDWPASTRETWAFKPYQPFPANIVLPNHLILWAEKYRGKIVYEPKIKPAAPVNKQWNGWRQMVNLRPDLPWLEMPELPSFEHALALISVARAAVLPEGGLHHAAAAFALPAVVIFGGYISPEMTGYNFHRNIFTGEKACGNRNPCQHCKEAMNAITPAIVLDQLEGLL